MWPTRWTFGSKTCLLQGTSRWHLQLLGQIIKWKTCKQTYAWTLCKKSGNLWSIDDIIVMDDIDTAKQEIECLLMLIGKLFTNPFINFQTFQNTMKKAWKNDSVVVSQLEQGLFLFAFKTERDKSCVPDGDPLSFAIHILLLKTWQPNTPSRSSRQCNIKLIVLYCTEYWLCSYNV